LGVALHGLRLLRWGCPDPSPAAETMTKRESKAFVGAALAPRPQSGGFAKHRQRQLPQRPHLVEDLLGLVQAGPAGGAAAGAHGQFGQGAAAGRRHLADLVVGDTVADTDVHGRGNGRGRRILLSNENHCQTQSRSCLRPAPAKAPRRAPRPGRRSTAIGGMAPAPAICLANGARWRRALAYTPRLNATTWSIGYQKSTQRHRSNSGLSVRSSRRSDSSPANWSRNQTCFWPMQTMRSLRRMARW